VNTRRYIPEDSKLHIRRRKNLKSHIVIFRLPVGSFLKSFPIKILYISELHAQLVITRGCSPIRPLEAVPLLSTILTEISVDSVNIHRHEYNI
jgi:hypothetical protein